MGRGNTSEPEKRAQNDGYTQLWYPLCEVLRYGEYLNN